MFWRLYQYSLRAMLRKKSTLFWSLAFPVVLGTLFQLTFGSHSEEFARIPVAYAAQGEVETSPFLELLDAQEGPGGLVTVRRAGRAKAEKLLREGKVEGIFLEKENGEVSLVVDEKGIGQSILSGILEQYARYASAFARIGAENPAGVRAAAEGLEKEAAYLREKGISDRPEHYFMDYFYSLLAMNCLMGMTVGVEIAANGKADLSDLAARKAASGAGRFWMILADLAAAVTGQSVCVAVSLAYLSGVLGIWLGGHYGLILLALMVGSALAVFLGAFIGVAGKWKKDVKEGICVAAMLASCFLSGLMAGGMYQVVEARAPIVNRLNPASLLVCAMRSLEIYGTYGRYARCVAALAAMTAVFGAGAYLCVRREQYDHI